VTSRYIPQLSFSFYRHRSIRVDFSGGQITSDAGLLPLRAFDHRHGLPRGLVQRVCDPRNETPTMPTGYARSGFSDSGRSTAGGTARITTNPQPMGELPFPSRAPQAAGCFTRLVYKNLRGTSPGTRRDPAGCRFHRRSHLRAAAAQFFQWWL